MSESTLMVLAVVGTCAFIFVASIALAPAIRNWRRAQGIDDGPEPPMSKQARTIAIICVGSATATLLLAFADGSLVLYVAAGAVFVAMMALVLRLSLRDGREAREAHRRHSSTGLGSST
jgi:hypothetical protein